MSNSYLLIFLCATAAAAHEPDPTGADVQAFVQSSMSASGPPADESTNVPQKTAQMIIDDAVDAARQELTGNNTILRAGEAATNGWKTVEVYVGSAELATQHGQLHSQVGQDWLVATLLSCMEDGFFVDLAANDAVRLSNTLMLERDFNWSGVCIEANPRYQLDLSKRRCELFVAAVGTPTDMSINFTFHGDKAALGGIVSDSTDNKATESADVVAMRTVSLAEVFQKADVPSVIDYMSLDVEGAESIVMDGFPWDKFVIRVLTVERPNQDLKKLLTNHGYQFLRINSGFDDQTWIHESLSNLTPIMKKFKNGASSNVSSCMEERGHGWPAKLQA